MGASLFPRGVLYGVYIFLSSTNLSSQYIYRHQTMRYVKAEASQDLGKIWGKVKSAMSGKVDKVHGKCLSTNDYTTEDKEKLDSIEPITNNQIDELFRRK